MTKQELQIEIRDLIFDRLEIDYIDKETVDFDAPIFSSYDDGEEGLGLDSVDALELVVGLNERYGVEISDEDMAIFQSISTIADFVCENKQ